MRLKSLVPSAGFNQPACEVLWVFDVFFCNFFLSVVQYRFSFGWDLPIDCVYSDSSRVFLGYEYFSVCPILTKAKFAFCFRVNWKLYYRRCNSHRGYLNLNCEYLNCNVWTAPFSFLICMLRYLFILFCNLKNEGLNLYQISNSIWNEKTHQRSSILH